MFFNKRSTEQLSVQEADFENTFYILRMQYEVNKDAIGREFNM